MIIVNIYLFCKFVNCQIGYLYFTFEVSKTDKSFFYAGKTDQASENIGDTKGNQLFIGVSPAIGNPYTSLEGDNNRPMMSANFTVTLDKDGVFTGVKQGDKTYNTADWNKMNQAKPTVKE